MAEAAISITNLRAALQYAERGWYVFPVYEVFDRRCACGRACGRPGKHPRTPNGWKDSSVDPGMIESWWRRFPEANIGVACGPSGLLVVDVDPRNNGDETFSDLELRHGAFPKTLTAITGGGGAHYFYDVVGVEGKFKGRVLGQGVELQGFGQYVVAAPSSHVSGQIYRWDFGQDDTPCAPPAWLVEEENRKSKNIESLGSPLDSILGVAFTAAAMLGPALGPDRAMVQCPWESDHTQGERFDGSAVVFGPIRGSRWGWFYCAHAHCKERLAGLSGVNKMHEVLRALPEKAAAIASEKIHGAERDLRKVVRAKWEESLVWDNKGERIVDTAGNLSLMLDNLPEWSGLVGYDESRDRLFWTRQPPEIPGLRTPLPGKEIGEHDWMYTSHWFSVHRRVVFRKETAADVLVAVGHMNGHSSLASYIEGVRWDGTKRLSHWLTTYCGAKDTVTTQRVGRAWLISALARALQPGVQVDHCLVLEGKQGAGKTSVFRILGGEWYLGNLPRLEDKDSKHILSGAWIIEIQELSALRGSSIERVKSYITERVDKYRPPYGRNFISRPRRCVFGGSTNEGEYIPDTTGARRFWPIQVTRIDAEALGRDRDQIVAEAREAYLDGELWYFGQDDGALLDDLIEEQASRLAGDPWEAKIGEYLEHRGEATVGDILGVALGIELAKRSPVDSRRVSAIVRALGFDRRRVQRIERGPKEWMFIRKGWKPLTE